MDASNNEQKNERLQHTFQAGIGESSLSYDGRPWTEHYDLICISPVMVVNNRLLLYI